MGEGEDAGAEVRLTFQQPGDVTGPVSSPTQAVEQGDAYHGEQADRVYDVLIGANQTHGQEEMGSVAVECTSSGRIDTRLAERWSLLSIVRLPESGVVSLPSSFPADDETAQHEPNNSLASPPFPRQTHIVSPLSLPSVPLTFLIAFFLLLEKKGNGDQKGKEL